MHVAGDEYTTSDGGLNPCYSGICSVLYLGLNDKDSKGLNPCYSGICSVSCFVYVVEI